MHRQWIPFHFMEVLRKFSREPGLQYLNMIVDMFAAFMEGKESSGDGWERLFLTVLMIRCLSRNTDWYLRHPTDILPFNIEKASSFSYNGPFLGDLAAQLWKSLWQELENQRLFHMSLSTIPPNASFQLYDVIVAHFDDHKRRALYGYRLNDSKPLPKSVTIPEFARSFVIRGEAEQVPGMGKDWVRPDEDKIDAFFGVSGRHWTPQRWKELNDAQ